MLALDEMEAYLLLFHIGFPFLDFLFWTIRNTIFFDWNYLANFYLYLRAYITTETASACVFMDFMHVCMQWVRMLVTFSFPYIASQF